MRIILTYIAVLFTLQAFGGECPGPGCPIPRPRPMPMPRLADYQKSLLKLPNLAFYMEAGDKAVLLH
jgi:hypothetical protein